MQRGRCWLRLGQPAKARTALEGAIWSLPAVYRRDRGVALSALATAFAAIGEPGEAAVCGVQRCWWRVARANPADSDPAPMA